MIGQNPSTLNCPGCISALSRPLGNQVMLEESPNTSDPTLLLDILATFLDESVPLPESRKLLGQYLPHLRRLAGTAPLVVSAKPMTTISLERQVLLDMLQAAADQCWVLEPVPEVKRQMELF